MKKIVSLIPVVAISLFGAVALDGGSANTANAIAIGQGSATTAFADAIAIGQGSSAGESGSIALGENAQSFGIDGVSIGKGSFANAATGNAVNVGASSETGWGGTEIFRQIKNVDEGTNDHDAVNKQQLDTSFLNSKTYADSLFSTVSTGISEEQVDNKVSKAVSMLEKKLSDEINQSAATSIALSQPLFFDSGDNALSIGTGIYENKQAMAINYGHKFSNFVVQGGIAINNHRAAKIGINYSW